MAGRRRTGPWLLGAVVALAAARGAAAPEGLRVAVMEFGAAGADQATDALGAGLQSMLTTDLAQVSGVTIVERARLRDVRAELKLGRSAMVDAATAAKMGKLLGATHLVTGSFTIAGNKMRLDARLVEVGTGKVALASSADGERDGFFELEKTLVNKLISSLDLHPTVKERGAVAKIHTTDFEAFRRFSDGIKLFDEQKYEDALAALKSAAQKDEEFKLARVTLGDYERIVADLRSRARDLDAEKTLAEGLAKQKAASAEQEVIGRLYRMGADPKEARERRAMALYLLCQAFGARYHKHTGGEEDTFAQDRTADALAARYHREAMGLQPRLPPIVNEAMSNPPRLPQLETFDKDFESALRRLVTWGHGDTPHDRAMLNSYRLEQTLRDIDDFARRLHLDRRGEVELYDRLYNLALALAPDGSFKKSHVEERAKLRRAVLDLDASTRLFTSLASDSKDAQMMRHLAYETERNGELAKATAGLPATSPVREYIMLEIAGRSAMPLSGLDRAFVGGALTPRGAHELTERRRLSQRDYVLIGDLPVWAIGEMWLSTGPRRDPLRADELRYYGPSDRRDAPDSLAIVEGVPRRDFELRAEVTFTPERDFWPRSPRREDTFEAYKLPGSDRRPRVTLLFAARDISAPDRLDPATGKKVPRPLRAMAARLGDTGIEVGDFVHKRAPSWDRSAPPTFTVKAERKLGAQPAGGSLAVKLRVAGPSATFTAGGASTSLALPPEHDGFVGLWFEGPGYAAIRKLAITKVGKP